MADNPISSFPIAELLKALGARPGNRKDTFHSPFRVDKDASLHINPAQNVWYDHGAGVGGGNIDLVMRCKGCTARQAARFIRDLPAGALVASSEGGSDGAPEGAPESGSSGASETGASGSGKSGERYPLANRILMIRDLHSPYLVEYCESRGIPAALAARYCKEIVMRGKKFGKTYDHIAFPNNVGGYALKAPSGFKCTTKGGITTIDMAGTLTEEPSTGTVTLGTMLAVFFATSDEMLPVMLASLSGKFAIGVGAMFGILAAKAGFGILLGYIADIAVKAGKGKNIHALCERDHCECDGEEGSVYRSALIHTAKITLMLLIVNVVLSAIIGCIGIESLSGTIINQPVIGELVVGLFGLIPNCAISIIITESYLSGVLGLGGLFAGLLANAGIGLIVLFRTNARLRENLMIVLIMYVLSVATGTIIQLVL